MKKNKKVFIVGAGGFIGGHLFKRILDNGNSVLRDYNNEVENLTVEFRFRN